MCGVWCGLTSFSSSQIVGLIYSVDTFESRQLNAVSLRYASTESLHVFSSGVGLSRAARYFGRFSGHLFLESLGYV